MKIVLKNINGQYWVNAIKTSPFQCDAHVFEWVTDATEERLRRTTPEQWMIVKIGKDSTP